MFPTGEGWECQGDAKVGGTHYWEPKPVTDADCQAIIQRATPGNAPASESAIARGEWQCSIKRQHQKVCRVMGGRQLQHCMWNTDTEHCSRGNIVDKAEACQGEPWTLVDPANWWCNTEADKSGLTTGWTCLIR